MAEAVLNVQLEIGEIRRWSPKPGDRLILKVPEPPGRITMHQAHYLQTQVRSSLQIPADYPVLILADGMEIEVAEGFDPSAENPDAPRPV